MTQTRSTIVSLETTPYYHCITRCVRRAFLGGNDRYSGKNFDHRKPWFIQRLDLLSEAFSIDICAYAIMSNHYHLVLHADKARCITWTQDQVIKQWLLLYKGPELIHRYLRNEIETEAEQVMVKAQVEIWRRRLTSISWFMRCLNEFVARKANKEDKCTGRFWESRFKSQALLDEAALLSCMTYVDLNPIRAGISHDLESSAYTSIRDRVSRIKQKNFSNIPRLMTFSETIKAKQSYACIPFNQKDYIALVDWTGRHVRNDKRGYITEQIPTIIKSLGLGDHQWTTLSLEVQKESISMLHGLEKLIAIEKRSSKKQVIENIE